MNKIILPFILTVIICYQGKSQLYKDDNSESTVFGLTISRTSITNSSVSSNNPKRSYDPYFSVGVDVIHHAYEKGDFRFFISSKGLTTDLIHSIVTITEDTQNDVRLDMTGFLWGKVGYNVYANDNLCIGVGASFADYIIDLPKWKPTINNPIAVYEEPTGYHLSAGPSLFLDYAIGDFVINSVSSYNLGFYYDPLAELEGGSREIDRIEEYDAPHFFSTALYANHTQTGLYLSFEYNKMIDKGIIENSLSRTEIALGWIINFGGKY